MYRVPPPPVGLIYHPLYWRNLHLIARTRCIASPPPPAETMTKGGHFRHPGRRWQAVPLHTTHHLRQSGYAVSQERHTMVRASASPSECSEFSEISDCFADARPKTPQCVKIRLNRQNRAQSARAPHLRALSLQQNTKKPIGPIGPIGPIKKSCTTPRRT